jgi:hypothetical protein
LYGKLPALGLIAAATCAACPATAGADVTISDDRTAGNVSAHHGQLVWNRLGGDARSRLVRRVGDANRDVPVRPKDGLFDPDTGTSRLGNQVIVYTRCAGLTARACDVWRYNEGTRRERKIAGASSERCEEFAPSVWIGTIAFARTGPGNCPGLYVLRRGRLKRLDRRVPSQTDIRGRRVAYLYTPAGDPSRTSVRIRSIYGGGSRRVVSGFKAQGESYRVTSPVLDGRYIYWLQEDRVRNEFFAGRGLAAGPGRLEFTQQTFPGRVTSVAVGDGRFYYVNGRGLHEATNPGFSPRD